MNKTAHELLKAWQEAGWINEIDLALAQFLANKSGQEFSEPFYILIAVLSHQLSLGHVCVDVEAFLKEANRYVSIPNYLTPDASLVFPAQVFANIQTAQFLQEIKSSAVTGEAADNTPLVLMGMRLYLRRYWQYEAQICLRIQQLMSERTLDKAQLARGLARYFSEKNDEIDWQKMACALALKSHFSVITGGPGTGKTTTVVKLLVLLQELQEKPLNIRLAAPTGKASARLKESITQALTRMAEEFSLSDELVASIPVQVQTLHKLLGKHGSTRRSRYHKGQPLPLDVLIIDEASMVDIEMMAQVLDALPDHASLILLGDKDQLASVEAGAMLGELCRNVSFGRANFNFDTAEWLFDVSGQRLTGAWLNDQASRLDQHIVMLQKSHRFSGDSGIGQLALAVNNGEIAKSNELLHNNAGDIRLIVSHNRTDSAVSQLLLGTPDNKGFLAYLDAVAQLPEIAAAEEQWDDWAATILKAFARFQLLCVTRDGEWGVKLFNQRVVQLLQHAQRIEHTSWFVGRPVMITHNDYQLGLMNGDIGMCLQKPVQTDHGTVLQKRVAFFDREGHIQWVLPSRLNQVETVFAMTVHKSQGSEFEHTVLILPEYDMPILSRELVYTGITRAKKKLTILCPQRHVLDKAIARRVTRSGGMRWQMDLA